MVIPAALSHISIAIPMLVDRHAEPLLQRLEPSRRVAVTMALLGIVIVGIFLIAVVLLGGNWARRLARHKTGSRSNYGRPLAPRRQGQVPPSVAAESSTDTISTRGSNRPTKPDR